MNGSLGPRPGAIAICQNGKVGLITRQHTEIVPEVYEVYTGLHLDEGRFGQIWQSKNPFVIGYIKDVVEDLLRKNS